MPDQKLNMTEDPGTHCPKCGKEFEVRPNCFAWRGRYFSGLACCGALWNNPKDSFLGFVEKLGGRVGD